MKVKLQDLINKAQLEEQSKRTRRGYVGASMVGGECEREVFYSFRQAVRPTFPARILRRFERGHADEDRVIEWLKGVGIIVHERRDGKQHAIESHGGLFGGHCDGLISMTDDVAAELGIAPPPTFFGVLEIKAVAGAKYAYSDETYTEIVANKTTGKLEGRFFELQRLGVRKAQQKHWVQMQAYMGGFSEEYKKPVHWALYVAVNTDTDQIYAEYVAFNPRMWESVKARVDRVISSEAEPQRAGENPNAGPCRFCDFKDICHRGDAPERPCRTCAHVRVVLPGPNQKRAMWVCDYHKANAGKLCANWTQWNEEVEF